MVYQHPGWWWFCFPCFLLLLNWHPASNPMFWTSWELGKASLLLHVVCHRSLVPTKTRKGMDHSKSRWFHPKNWGRWRCAFWRAYLSGGLVQPPTSATLWIWGPNLHWSWRWMMRRCGMRFSGRVSAVVLFLSPNSFSYLGSYTSSIGILSSNTVGVYAGIMFFFSDVQQKGEDPAIEKSTRKGISWTSITKHDTFQLAVSNYPFLNCSHLQIGSTC